MPRTLIHMEIGDSIWAPTTDDLKKIVQDFQSKKSGFGIGGASCISAYDIPDTPHRYIIQAGDADWDPTQEELDALVQLFQQAELDPSGSVVATRAGVKVCILDTPESTITDTQRLHKLLSLCKRSNTRNTFMEFPLFHCVIPPDATEADYPDILLEHIDKAILLDAERKVCE